MSSHVGKFETNDYGQVEDHSIDENFYQLSLNSNIFKFFDYKLDLNDLFKGIPSNNIYIQEVKKVLDDGDKLKSDQIIRFENMLHLPSKFNVLSLIDANTTTNEDNEGVIS